MTAEVVNLFPTGSDADDVVRQTVRAVMKGKGMSVEEVAPHAQMSPATLYRKLAGKGSREAFKAGEVATLARILNVGVEALYSGLGGTFLPPNPTGPAGSPDAGLNATQAYRTALSAA